MPLADRDYMRQPSPRRTFRFSGWGGGSINPLLVLIIINIVVFLVTAFSRRAFASLALMPAALPQKPWTLLTAMFVHSGLWHLLFNIIALYFFGNTLISLAGRNRFLAAYFTGGICGNILFLLLNLDSFYYLVGASGAVYGLAGSLVVMVPRMRVALWGIIPMPLWVFVLVFLVLLSLPPFVGGSIAWQAHIGGLASGLVLGVFFRRRIRYDFYW
ncbi:MAG: rhomboid family intramembrane serine protease [Dehalococcoidales bacterium]|nr:rhomboid family intramembrane serine protease [Dehalococcoidales bacterium]